MTTYSPAAPMDLAAMETEAKEKARKQVSNLLQRPDQLEKVEQIRKRVTRKKTSVEAMLKTAVQSQLDGVRTGLNQLQSALQDIREIKNSLQEVETNYQSISHLGEKLKKVRDENSRHSQLGAAVENLKHIFNVPEVVKKTEDFINDGKLLHAHKTLTELQMARDDLLFELHKQTQQSPTDKNTVNHYFAEVDKLSESLGKQLWLILQRTMVTIRREPTIIVTVLRIIEREERMDSVMLKRYDQTGFLPPGRPKRWRMKCFEVLKEAVQARVEGSQMEDRTMEKMWLVRHLEVTRQLVLEDLRVVKTLCEACFPPYYDIVQKYIEMYHNAISQHLNEVVQQGLEGNEIVSLLHWIHSYNTHELMGHPDLKINTSEFGPLLENSVITGLQNQYLQTLRGNFEEWMSNSLRSDIKDWYRDQEPDADDKGFFNTSLPVILFQMIEQNLHVAATISDSLVFNVLTVVAEELDSFCRTYKAELQNYKEKHFANRSEPQYFFHYMIANINNAETFADLLKVIQMKYKGTEIRDADYDRRFELVAKHYHELAGDGCLFLLEEVFMDLDVHIAQLMTRTWLSSSNAADTMCITIEDYCQDFVHLKDSYYDLLLEKAQFKILIEYLRALFTKRLVFKSYEERCPAADKLVSEAEQFINMFSKLENHPKDGSPFELLIALAEVLKLKDTSMMSLEISGFVSKFPDIKADQLTNLLLMRGDIGRSDARQVVLEALGEEDKSGGIFAMVPS